MRCIAAIHHRVLSPACAKSTTPGCSRIICCARPGCGRTRHPGRQAIHPRVATSKHEQAQERTKMGTNRLEAFSDGVIAIIITIMVLELKVPHGADLAALAPVLPVLLSYVLSFIYVGIYWNNHHHMLHLCSAVSGSILWANLHLLFWLSLLPFATAWMGENHLSILPSALYGVILLMAAIAYWILQLAIIAAQGPGSILERAVGRDWKGKV